MKRCWHPTPHKRPSFSDLKPKFRALTIKYHHLDPDFSIAHILKSNPKPATPATPASVTTSSSSTSLSSSSPTPVIVSQNKSSSLMSSSPKQPKRKRKAKQQPTSSHTPSDRNNNNNVDDVMGGDEEDEVIITLTRRSRTMTIPGVAINCPVGDDLQLNVSPNIKRSSINNDNTSSKREIVGDEEDDEDDDARHSLQIGEHEIKFEKGDDDDEEGGDGDGDGGGGGDEFMRGDGLGRVRNDNFVDDYFLLLPSKKSSLESKHSLSNAGDDDDDIALFNELEMLSKSSLSPLSPLSPLSVTSKFEGDDKRSLLYHSLPRLNLCDLNTNLPDDSEDEFQISVKNLERKFELSSGDEEEEDEEEEDDDDDDEGDVKKDDMFLEPPRTFGIGLNPT
jgi:hypothetical protein